MRHPIACIKPLGDTADIDAIAKMRQILPNTRTIVRLNLGLVVIIRLIVVHVLFDLRDLLFLSDIDLDARSLLLLLVAYAYRSISSVDARRSSTHLTDDEDESLEGSVRAWPYFFLLFLKLPLAEDVAEEENEALMEL